MQMERLLDPILRRHVVKQDSKHVEAETNANEMWVPVGVKAMALVFTDIKQYRFISKFIANDELRLDGELMQAIQNNNVDAMMSLSVPISSTKSVHFGITSAGNSLSREEFLRTVVTMNIRVADDHKAVKHVLDAAKFEGYFLTGVSAAFGNLKHAKHIIQKHVQMLMADKKTDELHAFVRFVIDDGIKLAAAKASFYYRAEKEYKKAVDAKGDASFDYSKSLQFIVGQHERVAEVKTLFRITRDEARELAFYNELLFGN